jgi:hypothetical protein
MALPALLVKPDPFPFSYHSWPMPVRSAKFPVDSAGPLVREQIEEQPTTGPRIPTGH